VHKKISEMTRSHEDTLVLEIAAESTVMDIEVINLRSVNQPTQQGAQWDACYNATDKRILLRCKQSVVGCISMSRA